MDKEEVPVTTRALIQRINRRLKPDQVRLKALRGAVEVEGHRQMA